MPKYFAKGTPLAELECMMMDIPGFQPRGGGIVNLSCFNYRAEDVECRHCQYYRQRACQIPVCPYVAERLATGVIGYRDLVLECFDTVPHLGFQRRLWNVVHWNGPDQIILERINVWQKNIPKSKCADNMPRRLAALYLLASRKSLWKVAMPAISPESIDFYRITRKGFDVQNYPVFYAAKRLYDQRAPMNAEELANSKLVDDKAFLDIIYATLIVRYGSAIMQKKEGG